MKKSTVLLAILITPVAVLASIMYVDVIYPVGIAASPGDVTITFTIPSAKVADFSAGFLAKCPIPMIDDPEDPDEQIPQYTAKQWIKEWMRRDVMRAYNHGKTLLAQQTAITDPNAIQ